MRNAARMFLCILLLRFRIPCTESVSHVAIGKTSEDDFKVAGPHVLASVHAETGDSEVDRVAHVADDFAPHVFLALVQIDQIHKSTVSHLVFVSVVFDVPGGGVTVSVVHVHAGIGDTGKVQRACIEIGASRAMARAAAPAHVIRNGVDEDSNSLGVASTHHVAECCAVP